MDSEFVTIQGRRIEYRRIAGDKAQPCLVFLHEGLGSIGLWRDFPERCAAATQCRVLVYSRYGYGWSDVLEKPREPRYMHDEALKSLPELLDRLEIEEPVLVGHSDGGSIALIYAGGSGRKLRGAVVMAPHVFVEPMATDGIETTVRGYQDGLRARMAKYHSDPDRTFRGWADIWGSAQFRDWNIEEYLPRIECPVLAIQGIQDEYGTMEQIDRIERGTRNIRVLKLDGCGHSPHRDQPEAVIEAIAQFLRN